MDTEKKKSGMLWNVVGIILCIIFIPIIIMNLILIIGTYTHPDTLPGVLGYKPVIVLSGSMEPTFMTGDMILLKDADTAALKEGDVICYMQEGSAVTHRIVKRTETDGSVQFTTKGDANNAEDPVTVSPDQVQGIYLGIRIPKAGDFAMFLQTTTGMILFIICPLILFFGWDYLHSKSKDKKELARTKELEAELEALKKQNQNKDS